MTRFLTAIDLGLQIEAYFSYIEGEYHLENKTAKASAEDAASAKKVWDREPEPGTFTGLAGWLGFNSRDEFFDYEQNGAFAPALKRGRLRIEAGYEKKLHHQSPAGAIFALKSMGWNEKAETKDNSQSVPTTMIIAVVESGPEPAGAEAQVIL
jgi:hypothetical protein